MTELTTDGFQKFVSASHLTTLCLVLVILMTLDVISGVAGALIGGEASSYKMKAGIVRKFLVMVIVFVASLMQFVYPPLPTGLVVCGYYCAAEAMSIIENAKKAGVPVPDVLTNGLSKLNGRKEGEDTTHSLIGKVTINKVETKNMTIPDTPAPVPVVVPIQPPQVEVVIKDTRTDSQILRDSVH